MTRTTKAAIIGAIIFWASAFVGIRAGLKEYSPEGMALLRYLVASLVMGVVYWTLPSRPRIKLVDKIGLLIAGAIGIGIYNLSLNYGEISVSSGIASFITSQSPVVTTIFAIIFLGECLNARRILGFLISLIGVIVIAYGEIGKFEMTAGLAYVCIAMVAGSCLSIMQKPYLRKYSAIVATSYVIWGGTLFLLAFIPEMKADYTHASLTTTLIVIYMGVFPAALAYVAWSYTLGKLSVSHAVSYLYVLPFVTAIMGWMLLGEVPALLSIIGAVIAVGGVWLVNQSYRPVAVRTPLVDGQSA